MLTNCFNQITRLYEHTDAIMICDKNGYVEYVKWMCEPYFLTSETIGKHVTDVYPELDNNTSTIMQTLKSGKPRYDERQIIHNYKGDLVDIVTSTLPIISNGELLGAMTASVFYEKYNMVSTRKEKKKNELYVLEDIITNDPTMTALKERCRIIAENDSPVLLYGETGTGKELFAQSLHTSSNREGKPFVSQNCAAIPESLLEGIFFGSEKGSFTGAETRKGLFELADGGTLFLDEINSMDVSMQAKLLKVIEEQKVRRLGGYKDIPFNTRIICAMNQKPTDVLKLGKIREDLFYRISVVRIDIPPLRNRISDIYLLTDYFIDYYNRKMGKHVLGVSQLVKMTFENYDWRGNVRELKNTLEGAFNLVSGNIINMTDIPNMMVHDGNNVNEYIPILPSLTEFNPLLSLAENVNLYEKKLIELALKKSNNISEAAKSLKISRQSLTYKIEKYRL